MNGVQRTLSASHAGPAGRAALWLPAGFCFALGLMKLFLPEGTGDPAFFCFLPMCFFYAGMIQTGLVRKVVELEERLERVERPGESGAAEPTPAGTASPAAGP